jgi:hypothetical protein
MRFGQHVILNLTATPNDLDKIESELLSSVNWAYRTTYFERRYNFTTRIISVSNSTTREVITGKFSDN